jgi:hypothetical protein
VQHALDLQGGDRCALDGRKQTAPHGVADRGREAALERLGSELAVRRRQCFSVYVYALGALKTLPKHVRSFPAA